MTTHAQTQTAQFIGTTIPKECWRHDRFSECCGAEVAQNDAAAALGFCPECRERCRFVGPDDDEITFTDGTPVITDDNGIIQLVVPATYPNGTEVVIRNEGSYFSGWVGRVRSTNVSKMDRSAMSVEVVFTNRPVGQGIFFESELQAARN